MRSFARRFTLFAPELVDRLYIGPLDLTPAGQPISLVDLAAPDLARFPRFAEALPQAQVVTLEPGDALFIPADISAMDQHIKGAFLLHDQFQGIHMAVRITDH